MVSGMLQDKPCTLVHGQEVPPAEPRLGHYRDCSRKSGVIRRWVELAVIVVRTSCVERELIGPPSRRATISTAAARTAECPTIPHPPIPRSRLPQHPAIRPD